MPETVKSLLVRLTACIKQYSFRMNIMEDISKIRSCIEILAIWPMLSKSTQLISICSTVMVKAATH